MYRKDVNYLLLAMSAILIVVMFNTSYVDADDNGLDSTETIFFDNDGIGYRVLDDRTVAMTTTDLDHAVELIVPSKVTWEGVTYTVVSLDTFSVDQEEIVSIHIPASVETIETNALFTTSLKDITVDEGNSNYFTIDGTLFDLDTSSLIRYPSEKESSNYVVPSFVLNISEYAFYGSKHLMNITLPSNLDIIRAGTFYDCPLLEKVGTADNPMGLPPNLVYIDSSAFDGCSSLGNIVLPSSLVGIGTSAFSNCTSLTTIHIPYMVSFIGKSAFSFCKSLAEITVSDENSSFISQDDILFSKNGNASSNISPLTLVVYPAAKTDETYHINDQVIGIEWGAFAGTENLKAIYYSNSLPYIPAGAFSDCTSLTEIHIPKEVLSIGEMAFSDCTSLTKIEGMQGVVSIGDMAFYDCGFTKFAFPESVETIGMMALAMNDALVEVHVPASVRVVGSSAFVGCTNLNSITFKGTDTVLQEHSLSITYEGEPKVLEVIAPNGFSLPDNCHDEFTLIELTILGKKPFPLENLVGIAICLVILFAIIRLFREV